MPLVPDRGAGTDAPPTAPTDPTDEVPIVDVEVVAAATRGDLPDYPQPMADLGLIEFWYNLPPWTQALAGVGMTAIVVWMVVTASVVVGGSNLLSRGRKNRR